MKTLPEVFRLNQEWAERVQRDDPHFFQRLSQQQRPRYLWIGCSDSRVPATQICGLDPGEIFVHRNIANQVIPGDVNALAVIQYAVEVLKVTDIIVCGHYGCGGVQAIIEGTTFGYVEKWLEPFKEEVAKSHCEELKPAVELNIKWQVENLSRLEIIRTAWENEQVLNLHGWVYDIHDGRLKDLDVCYSNPLLS